MALVKCRLCGKLFATENGAGFRGMCRECTLRLEELYDRSGIHNYLRRYGTEGKFDPDKIAHDLEMNPRDVRLLFDMGYLDRDIQVYSREPSPHDELADEFKRILDRERKKTLPPPPPPRQTGTSRSTSYGGRVYRRK